MKYSKYKRIFYSLIHLLFTSSILYAFFHFLKTPRTNMFYRRMWAYESWIIISFYVLFLYLALTEDGKRFLKIKDKFAHFKRVLMINLLLLIFPWGLLLLLAPPEMLGMVKLDSIYWRILGFFSLLGAIVYYFAYRFYKYKLSYYILIFGAVDNLLAGIIALILFMLQKVPLVSIGCVPLLLYFSFFFVEQALNYNQNIKDLKKSESIIGKVKKIIKRD